MTNVDPFDSSTDGYGYPSEVILELVAIKHISSFEDFHYILDLVKTLWAYPEYATVSEDGKTYTFRTGGWSGNEALISAMEMNIVFWSMCWYMSQRGGLYVFKLRETE